MSLAASLAGALTKAGVKSDEAKTYGLRLSTGVPNIDHMICGKYRGGGFQSGRIVEISGPSSSGKTLLAQHVMKEAQQHGLHPGYAIYEAGFVRLGAALARAHKGLRQPVYRLMFSEGFNFGFPPADYALDAYLQLLAREAPTAPWMLAGLGVDVLPLVATAVSRGGHVRVGLEDAPLGSELGNLDWVRAGRAAIERARGSLATATEVRRALSAAR